MSPAQFRASAMAVGSHWKEAGRAGDPLLTLRVPLLLDGVHRAAVDPALLGTRYLLQGSVANVARDLRAYRAAGCSHVALEVSYTTYPAILDTLDILVEEVRPAVDQR